MRFPIIQAIYHKEMLDILRDRRTVISMVVVPLLVFPVLLALMTRVGSRRQASAEAGARTMGIAAHVSAGPVRDALDKASMPVRDRDDPRLAVEKKEAAVGVNEIPGTIEILEDSSNPASIAAGDTIRGVILDLKDQRIRQSLRKAGISESVLTPFVVRRTNVAGERKMAGSLWGAMLGYILMLLMFTGGIYPVIDMTAGEKERKTLEAFLASPSARSEIVMGKTLAAMTAIFLTAALTLASLMYSLKNNRMSTKSEEIRAILRTLPLDANTVAMIAATLVPVVVFAASVMFTIALLARSYKEAQSYLTPLALAVIIPAIIGGLPGLQLTPALCLIPIFNASMVIKSVLLGEVSRLTFALSMGANVFYAAIAFVVAIRLFEKESVLFRS